MIQYYKDKKLIEKYSTKREEANTDFIEENEKAKEVSLYNVQEKEEGLTE
jgi:hypothetical protein